MHVVSEQREPILVAALIERCGFRVIELLDEELQSDAMREIIVRQCGSGRRLGVCVGH